MHRRSLLCFHPLTRLAHMLSNPANGDSPFLRHLLLRPYYEIARKKPEERPIRKKKLETPDRSSLSWAYCREPKQIPERSRTLRAFKASLPLLPPRTKCGHRLKAKPLPVIRHSDISLNVRNVSAFPKPIDTRLNR